MILMRCISLAAWAAALAVYFTGGPEFFDSVAHTLVALPLAALGYAAWVPARTR